MVDAVWPEFQIFTRCGHWLAGEFHSDEQRAVPDKIMLQYAYGVMFLAFAAYYGALAYVGSLQTYVGFITIALVIAAGLFMRKRWTEAAIFGIALYGTVAWIAEVLVVAVTAWPYSKITESLISLIPGVAHISLFVVMWWLVRRHFRSTGAGSTG